MANTSLPGDGQWRSFLVKYNSDRRNCAASTHVEGYTMSLNNKLLSLLAGLSLGLPIVCLVQAADTAGGQAGGGTMKGYVQDIENIAIKNNDFRQVLYTAKHCQLVVMSLKPKEEIGAEVHKLDQFFRVEEGSGEVVLDGVRTAIRAGFAAVSYTHLRAHETV